MPPSLVSLSRPWRIAAATFGLALGFFLLMLHCCPLLYDADAYYHLAIARIYAERGLVHQLPELRFSLLGTDFGDKELLFHGLLWPLAKFGEAGGRLALALLASSVFALIAGLAVPAARRWAVLVPFGLFFGALDFSWRLVRLRPELLSLLLLIALVWAVAHERPRWAGLVAAVYTWSYTAFQAALGLALLLAVVAGWPRRRRAWGLVLYPMLGVALALSLHPQFPANLEVWAVQNVAFFSLKDTLDVGSEIEPHAWRDVLLLNLGWWLAALALWRSRKPRPAVEAGGRDEANRRAAIGFGIAALVFGALYLRMSRFGVYFFPFATLCLLTELGRRGGASSRVRLWGGRSLPLALALTLAAFVALPEAIAQSRIFMLRTSAGPNEERVLDRERFARAVPDGARVAAPWRATALYLFLAPQGRYLNALDPVFMAVPYPEAYLAQRDVWSGVEPDIPRRVAADLDSEYLAFSLASEAPELKMRLLADPRVEPAYQGIQGLFRLRPGQTRSFVLEWRLAPPGASAATPLADIASWPAIPGAAGGHDFAGFVEPESAAQGACSGAGRVLESGSVAAASPRHFEFAPYGTGRLWIDGRLAVTVTVPRHAVLGQGALLSASLAPGGHSLVVEVCPPSGQERGRERNGFYLREISQ